MLYVTGDTHGGQDGGTEKLHRIAEAVKGYKDPNPCVVILGDFGYLWKADDGAHLIFKDFPFKTYFIDGNHENFQLLENFPVQFDESWSTGFSEILPGKLFYLRRGHVHKICGYTVFTMGGATSLDKLNRLEHISWWKEEEPDYADYETALRNLESFKCENGNVWDIPPDEARGVDFIFTHTAPKVILERIDFSLPIGEANQLNTFLTNLERNYFWMNWCFGHFHIDWKQTNFPNQLKLRPFLKQVYALYNSFEVFPEKGDIPPL